VRPKRPGRELVRVTLRGAYEGLRGIGDVKLRVSWPGKTNDHRHSTARPPGCAGGLVPLDKDIANWLRTHGDLVRSGAGNRPIGRTTAIRTVLQAFAMDYVSFVSSCTSFAKAPRATARMVKMPCLDS
jgi:hypothetical protein